MNILTIIILSFVYYCKSLTYSINEFEEIEIQNFTQILEFNNSYTEELDYYPEIIIICMNPYFQRDTKSELVIFKNIKKKFPLQSYQTFIVSRNDDINEGEGLYKLLFKNYIGGKIIIFNSLHSYPLKNFSKPIFFLNLNLNSNFTIKLQSVAHRRPI